MIAVLRTKNDIRTGVVEEYVRKMHLCGGSRHSIVVSFGCHSGSREENLETGVIPARPHIVVP
jgi:hypothetical protein